jgi:hemolysin activation/secretion protein
MKAGWRQVRSGLNTAALLAFMLFATTGTQAASLPGPADVGRLDQRERLHTPEKSPQLQLQPMQVLPNVSAPEGSKQTILKLKDVRISGMTAFTRSDVEDIYAPYLDHEVTLDTVWLFAGQLTERYHNAGYFLSRVIVPQQEIKDGVVILRAVEGYIGDVKFKDSLAQNRVVKQWINKLLSYRPIKITELESVLLSLKDLPGVDLRAVLQPEEAAKGAEDAVDLVLERTPVPVISGGVSFDDYSSRFFGPYEAQVQAQVVYWPTQKTIAAFLSSLARDKVMYGSLKHELPVFAGGTLALYGAHTNAVPGYTLEALDIKSHSTTVGASLNYSVIRQRQENLTGGIVLELRNTKSDILNTPLVRDKVRVARLNLNYQKADRWSGKNTLDATLSQGLSVLGSSKAGDLNLSRSAAKPNFTKFTMSLSRLQDVTENWDINVAASGQIASGSLYSSEQFGYGGQAFGRAYDDSEITGDRGMAASAELRYLGFRSWKGFQVVPYEFYDIGAVWNDDKTAVAGYASGSSAGAGMRVLSEYGVSGNFGLAFPLTRAIDNPLYGNRKNPRYFVQISYGF